MNLTLDDTTKKIIFHIATNHDSVVILDASYHMYRFAYVHRTLSIEHKGMIIPTGHIYGFLKMIAFLKRKFKNPAIIIAVDGYDKERKKENPNYKGDRDNKEHNIHGYIPDVVKLSSMMPGVYTSYNGDYEADDTIYNVSRTLDTLFKQNSIDRNIYIYAQDKDLYQCINDKILVVKSWGKGTEWFTKADIVDVAGVQEAFHGVCPDKIAMFRSISGGDSSDNIKGYYRFPRSKAAYLVDTCDITENALVPKNPEEFKVSMIKYLNVVNSEFDKFKSNYKIMRMKEYDFTLRIANTDGAGDLLYFYKLNSYKKELSILANIKV